MSEAVYEIDIKSIWTEHVVAAKALWDKAVNFIIEVFEDRKLPILKLDIEHHTGWNLFLWFLAIPIWNVYLFTSATYLTITFGLFAATYTIIILLIDIRSDKYKKSNKFWKLFRVTYFYIMLWMITIFSLAIYYTFVMSIILLLI